MITKQEIEWKFDIGQPVCFVGELAQIKASFLTLLQFLGKKEKLALPNVFLVISRTIDQCHGGTQDFYGVGTAQGTRRCAPCELISLGKAVDEYLGFHELTKEDAKELYDLNQGETK